MYNGGMNIKGIILGAVRSLLWFSLAFGLGWAALYAVRYAALTFYYDYGQHVLLEPIVQAEAGSVEPANEGRLVQVTGIPGPDQSLRDPLYGIEGKGLRMVRQVRGEPQTPEEDGKAAPQAPVNPPEPHLQGWKSSNPIYLGSYELRGLGLENLGLTLISNRAVLSVMVLPPGLREQAEIKNGHLVMPSSNGFKYQVAFNLYKIRKVSFLGRQRGRALESNVNTVWRANFMDNHVQLPLYRAAMNACFFLLLAWAATTLALYTLTKGLYCRLKGAELAWYALLISGVASLGIYGILVDTGALWNNPIWDPRGPTTRRFVQNCFPPERVETAHLCLWVGMGLCLLLAAAPTMLKWWRKRHAIPFEKSTK